MFQMIKMSFFSSLSMENHDEETDFRYEGKTCPSVTKWKPDLSGNFLLSASKSEGQECRLPVLWEFIKLSYFSVS